MPRGRPKKVVARDPNAPVYSPDEAISVFLRELMIVEENQTIWREHLKDLKTSFVDNGHLTKEQIQGLIKAYKLYSAQVDMELLSDDVRTVEETILSGFKMVNKKDNSDA